ncbi:MAG: exopolysaccharide biosynthesis protein [Armatimonadetes bacterium]|nr:exopolysaccharide biosynthesis protein [Armatimonadota bacterium]
MGLSDTIKQAFDTEGSTITLQEFLVRLDAHSFGVLLVVVSLPSLIPAFPGFATPFGFLAGALAIQMLRGRAIPWFPKKVLNRPMKPLKRNRIMRGALWVLKKIEVIVKPRGGELMQSRRFQRFLTYVVLACAISMAMPVPGTNSLPALGIILIGLAMTEEDSVSAYFGVFWAVVGIGVTTAVFILLTKYGFAGAESAYEAIKDWLLRR